MIKANMILLFIIQVTALHGQNLEKTALNYLIQNDQFPTVRYNTVEEYKGMYYFKIESEYTFNQKRIAKLYSFGNYSDHSKKYGLFYLNKKLIIIGGKSIATDVSRILYQLKNFDERKKSDALKKFLPFIISIYNSNDALSEDGIVVKKPS